jgi:hypothetical protein
MIRTIQGDGAHKAVVDLHDQLFISHGSSSSGYLMDLSKQISGGKRSTDLYADVGPEFADAFTENKIRQSGWHGFPSDMV